MSGISEVDIKDFERVDVKAIRQSIASSDAPPDLFYLLNEYCNIIESLQRKLVPQTAALFKQQENT